MRLALILLAAGLWAAEQPLTFRVMDSHIGITGKTPQETLHIASETSNTSAVEVKELTKTQQAVLSEAKKNLDRAQEQYDATKRGVLAAYEIYERRSGWSTELANCFRSDTTGELIDNRWIVVKRTSIYVCGPAIIEAEPIK